MSKPCNIRPKRPPKNQKIRQETDQKIKGFFEELRSRSGVLSSSQKLEHKLTENYILGVTKVAVPAKLDKFNYVESQMAKLMGWKKWLWQKTLEFTPAGAIRETLVRQMNDATETIRLIALDQSLPQIRQMYNSLKRSLPDVPVKELEKLLHDHIVIGSYPKLLNINPNESVNSLLQKRYFNHIEKLRELGMSDDTIVKLTEVAERIMNTYDELSFAARENGLNLETLENGGYFPLQAQKEFEDFMRRDKSGVFSPMFRSLKEDLQKGRKLGLPVALDEDKVIGLLYNRLTGTDLSDGSVALLSAKEMDLVAEGATKAKELIDVSERKIQANYERQWETFVKESEAKRKLALAKTEQVATAQEQAAVNKLMGELKGSYSLEEKQAVVNNLRQEWNARRLKRLEDVNNSFDNLQARKSRSFGDKVREAIQKSTDAIVKKQEKHVQMQLQWETARYALREIQSSPEGLGKLLSTFDQDKIQKLFDSGALGQLPLLSNEIENFYRGLDLGIEGMADAIISDPVKALQEYTKQLSGVVGESRVLKEIFTDGFEEGWVSSTKLSEDFIPVETNELIVKHFGSGNLKNDIGGLYIHRTVAEQIDGLLQINKSPSALAWISNGWQMFTSSFGKSVIVGTGGLPYLQRVFTQNLPAIYGAAGMGGIAQLPISIVENLRVVKGGIDSLDDTRKIFFNGTMTTKEAYVEFIKRTGGSVLSGFQDNYDVFSRPFESFNPDFWRRNQLFHEAYFRKFGNPFTGKMETYAKAVSTMASDTLNSLYAPLAFGNHFLDNSAKWAVFRELASKGTYESVDEVVTAAREYFDLSNDPGIVGSAVSRNLIPFASFALNAPGAALRHAINHPWRAMNIMQLYMSAAASMEPTEAELPPWMRESQQFAIQVTKDYSTGEVGVIFPGTVDYMLDSYDWMGRLFRDLASDRSNVTAATEERTPIAFLTEQVNAIVSKTYAGNILNALQGIDPRTLEKINDPNALTTFFGVPVNKQTRMIIESAVPVLRSIESSLPAAIVGQPAQRNITPAGDVPKPGTPGWLGFTPASGAGAKRQRDKALLSMLTGVSVSTIDPKGNLITTYRDFDSRLREFERIRRELFKQEMQPGIAEPQKLELRKRRDELGRLAVILQYNKMQIDNYAVRKGMPIPSVMEQWKRNSERILLTPMTTDTELRLLNTLNGGSN